MQYMRGNDSFDASVQLASEESPNVRTMVLHYYSDDYALALLKINTPMYGHQCSKVNSFDLDAHFTNPRFT